MPAKILFVDDEPQFERLIKQRFRSELREGTFTFVFAENGQQALAIIDEQANLDMVLTDINMPIMDGLNFLTRLKERGSLLKTVVVSAYGDMDNIRKAMNLGAFDFITKPIDFSDLRTTIHKTLEETELIKQAEQAAELAKKNKQLQELNALKSHFFTNISHELRTPLTIITGVAQQLADNPEQWGTSGVEMIQRNSNHLLDLVNQILDLRKLEMGKMQLQLMQSDVVGICNYIVESFKFLAEQKGIQLHLLSDVDTLIMDNDSEKLSRILSNLLSNAIKHTDKGGNIYILLSVTEHKQLKLKVKDTGKGISVDQITHIFQRFYQDPNSQVSGTGIGLALVKELTTLMEGSITVESEIGKGSVFALCLPITNNTIRSEQFELDATINQVVQSVVAVQPEPGVDSLSMQEESLPKLLIVEDNNDVVTHLLHCLGNQYQPAIAQNGQEGIDKAFDLIPDIIISDVMMPEKDGFELCETLKQDVRTSHIPIVLLTAKADVENRIAGLTKGADTYLAKPFDRHELSAVLQQLLKQRALLKARYTNLEITSDDSQKEDTYNFSSEDAFLQKAISLVKNNMIDSDFTVQVFCRAMRMSYPVIHRKLAALIGKSPALFIRSVRLHHAKKQLKEPDKTIAEIAYDSGFSDPKYFSRVFSEEFDAPPSAFR